MEIKRIFDPENSEHVHYVEFDNKQIIIGLDVGETAKLVILDANGDEKAESSQIPLMTCKYINCHVNLHFLDKGVKTTPPES
jgi:hypothetical protein